MQRTQDLQPDYYELLKDYDVDRNDYLDYNEFIKMIIDLKVDLDENSI